MLSAPTTIETTESIYDSKNGKVYLTGDIYLCDYYFSEDWFYCKVVVMVVFFLTYDTHLLTLNDFDVLGTCSKGYQVPTFIVKII